LRKELDRLQKVASGASASPTLPPETVAPILPL